MRRRCRRGRLALRPGGRFDSTLARAVPVGEDAPSVRGPSMSDTAGGSDLHGGSTPPTALLSRAALILDAFDGEQAVLNLNELSEASGLPKSTVHRIAEQLLALGWLERELLGYRIGVRMFEIGGLSTRRNRIHDVADPYLQRLASSTRCTVHLAVLDRFEVLYLKKLSADGLALPTREGGRMPAHCTALGKAMLAFAAPDEVRHVLDMKMDKLTPFTITSPQELVGELRRVRTSGIATDNQENTDGVVCVSSPIRGSGRAIGAISVTGSSTHFSYRSNSIAVRQAAAGIWTSMFGRTIT